MTMTAGVTKKPSWMLISVLLSMLAVPVSADQVIYRVLVSGEDTGHLIVDTEGDYISIDFDYKQNGRGPTFSETLKLDQRGFPIDWKIMGTTTFGSPVEEYFQADDNVARWRDATGPGDATYDDRPDFYINQSGSSYANSLLVRVLLKTPDGKTSVYPGGEASVVKRWTRVIESGDVKAEVTAYQILGLDTAPRLVFFDADNEYFGTASPRSAILREGFEAIEHQLRALSEELSTDRFVNIQAEVAHQFDRPVRIRNVRIFDPKELSLTTPKDVVIYGERIASVQPAKSPTLTDEVLIDGEGGALVPGIDRKSVV